MAISTLLIPRFFKEWELDPSTRESMRLFQKPYPVDVTLAVAQTAQDLITVSPGDKATVNIITNPSMETNITGYSAVRTGALSQSATAAKYGVKSLKIIPPNVARGEGASWPLGNIPNDLPFSISAWFTNAVGAAGDARVELFAAVTPNTKITNVRVAVGSTVSLDATWKRSVLAYPMGYHTLEVLWITGADGAFVEDEVITGATSGATAVINTVGATYLVVRDRNGQFTVDKGLPASEVITGTDSGFTATLTKTEIILLDNASLYLYAVSATKHGTTFYVDGVQAEFSEQPTTYCDGAQGYFHWWDGVAQASTSRRWRKLSSIRSYRFHCTKAVYVHYDQPANHDGVTAQDKGEYLPANTDWGEDHPIYLDKQISFVNVVDGELPRIYGLIWGC